MNIINCILSTTFWTAISAIATAVMAVFTYKALSQNRKQLNQMKQQWEEENKPILEISIINPPNPLDTMDLYFEIQNIGKGLAKNISISFDESIKDIPVKSIYENAKKIKNKTFSLLPNKSILIPFISFSYDSSNEYKLIFYRSIDSDQYKLLEEYLKNNSIDVKCKYEGISEYKKYSFSYHDRDRQNMTTESILYKISKDFEKIIETFQNKENNNDY